MSREDHQEQVRSLRHELGERRRQGGFDESCLWWADWYLDQADDLLAEPDFEQVHQGVFVAYLESAVRYLAWARHPVRDAEAQRQRARQPRSEDKQRALDLYRRHCPGTCKDFMFLMDQAAIDYTLKQAERWFGDARKRIFPR